MYFSAEMSNVSGRVVTDIHIHTHSNYNNVCQGLIIENKSYVTVYAETRHLGKLISRHGPKTLPPAYFSKNAFFT